MKLLRSFVNTSSQSVGTLSVLDDGGEESFLLADLAHVRLQLLADGSQLLDVALQLLLLGVHSVKPEHKIYTDKI